MCLNCEKELAEKYQQAQTWTDFIVTSGRQSWPTVQAQLAAAETRIKEIEEILAHAKQTLRWLETP
jgi:hypothetical protein